MFTFQYTSCRHVKELIPFLWQVTGVLDVSQFDDERSLQQEKTTMWKPDFKSFPLPGGKWGKLRALAAREYVQQQKGCNTEVVFLQWKSPENDFP